MALSSSERPSPVVAISIAMEAAFCVETLEDALASQGKPDIFNTDQARSSRVLRSPACSPVTGPLSAWMAETPGATTCWSSGCGAASKYEEVYLRATTRVSDVPLDRLIVRPCTMAGVLSRALTASHPIK